MAKKVTKTTQIHSQKLFHSDSKTKIKIQTNIKCTQKETKEEKKNFTTIEIDAIKFDKKLLVVVCSDTFAV